MVQIAPRSDKALKELIHTTNAGTSEKLMRAVYAFCLGSRVDFVFSPGGADTKGEVLLFFTAHDWRCQRDERRC